MGEACRVGQPLPRGGAGPRGVRAPARREDGLAQAGRGTEEDVKVGPLIDEPSRARRWPSLSRTRSTRARPAWSAATLPAVLGGVSDDARMLREEIFGPVAPVTSFESEEDAIARAIDTDCARPRGLRVHARHQARAARLQPAVVGLNQGMVCERRRASAASSSRASAARAARRASRSSSRRSTWPSTSDGKQAQEALELPRRRRPRSIRTARASRSPRPGLQERREGRRAGRRARRPGDRRRRGRSRCCRRPPARRRSARRGAVGAVPAVPGRRIEHRLEGEDRRSGR